MSRSTHASNRSASLGIIFIILGSLFLIDNFNLIPYDITYYFFNWKGILLLIGGVMLASKENKTPGIVMVSIASFFIVSDIMSYEFHWHWYDTRKFFWPVVLIVIGLIILSRRTGSSKGTLHGSAKTGEGYGADHLNVTSALGGGDIVVNSKNFQGGKVTSILGGGKYDLSSAELANGSHEIDLLAMFGGAVFVVPSDWNVRIEVTSIFGGFSDNRKIKADTTTDMTKELIIKGTVLFGGGEVKNYI